MTRPYRDRKEESKQYYLKNKERLAEQVKNWTNRNPSYYLLKLYGIAVHGYNRLFEEQQGCCAICNRHQITFKRRLSVDHNHTTGKVRGLLCVACNTDLGVYENRKMELEDYLNEYN